MQYAQQKQKRRTRIDVRSGFSLVETLVAITILLVAIVGPMTIAARGLQSAFYVREQTTAFMLAEEGVELVRAWRDGNVLRDADWLDGLPPWCTNNVHGCGVDVRGSAVRNCNTADECKLNYDDSGARGLYTYAAGIATPYTRRIWVDPVNPGRREATVTVEVTWRSGLLMGEKTITLQSRIFDVYDNI